MGLFPGTKKACKGLREAAESYKKSDKGKSQYDIILEGLKEETRAKSKKAAKEREKIQDDYGTTQTAPKDRKRRIKLVNCPTGYNATGNNSNLNKNVARNAYQKARGNPSPVVSKHLSDSKFDKLVDRLKRQLEEENRKDLEEKLRAAGVDFPTHGQDPKPLYDDEDNCPEYGSSEEKEKLKDIIRKANSKD